MKSHLNLQNHSEQPWAEAVALLERVGIVFGTIGTRWRNWLGTLLIRLSASSEPEIWSVQDAKGVLHWKAFDPKTGMSVDYTSVEELLIWLESRSSL